MLALAWFAVMPNRTVIGTPQVRVDTERLELGVQSFNHPVRGNFVITNVGNGTLTLNAPASPTVLQGCCPDHCRANHSWTR